MSHITHDRLVAFTLLIALSVSQAAPAHAEISKADRLFMKNGLYMHALCFHDHLLHLKTLKDCGFTGVTWGFVSNMKQLGPPPGMPWCRWLNDENSAVTPEEQPSAPN